MWSRKLVLVAVLALPAALSAPSCSSSGSGAGPGPSRTGLFVSDFHFNPLDDATIADRLAQSPASQWDSIFATSTKKTCSPYEHDTNYPLLTSALAAMRRQVPDPDIVFVSGDFLAHEFQLYYYTTVTHPSPAGYAAMVDATEQYLAIQLSQTFPDSQIVPTLGDWDTAGTTDEYATTGFRTSFASAWDAAVNRYGGAPEFRATFSAGGWYSTAFPIDPRGRLVVLYTQPWAAECTKGCGPGTGSLGDAELQWLSTQLADARSLGQRVWLLGHIPPGICAAETFQNISGGSSCPAAISPFWADAYSSGLYELLADYRDTLTLGLFAHEHTDDYRVLLDARGDLVLGVKLVPSVTPIEKNNPAFVQFVYDPGLGVISDAKTWYLTNLASAPTAETATWEFEYDFGLTYGQQALDSSGVAGTVTSILSEAAAQSAYETYYPASNPAGNPPGAFTPFLLYGCALENVTEADFGACYCGD